MGMGKIRKLIRKWRLKERASSETYLNYLRQKGAKIGTDVHLYSTTRTLIDSTNPCLLTIGDHVRITEGVIILTHDYAWSVLKCCTDAQVPPGSVLGAQSPVEIGSNVFIGMNTIITRGTTIGDNVIIGAGSVVTHDCPSGGVYAGNPAKRIMSIGEYFQKRKELQFEEAKTLALRYRERFGKVPPKECFAEYFMLFSTLEEAQQTPAFREKMVQMEGYGTCVDYMTRNEPRFAGYEAFLRACYEGDA